ncbi:sensor protein KdpD [Pedobacter glucosidilyticus]|uniref:sensor protein KdpD n=1 Tax=Pedobacter glucosidilyticus TaxID=1122941 RepID=UPI0026EC200B|nr:sensor protein KdpD [Pedobacter glucosidilyticus]
MQQVSDFLELVKSNRRGKFKVYIGMSAGVGKTYKMLQEAHALLANGIDVKIAFIETHLRKETHALLDGLPIITRRKLFYKGKELEELDVQAVINLHPEVVIIDELAHTNIEGSKNEKRWQDVLDILNAGINVISAVNIQHLESLNEDVKAITGIEVQERVPDKVLQMADEVVNIDLTADELIDRLKTGKIYTLDKVPLALRNFFQIEKILQLRELALREVSNQLERKIQTEVPKQIQLRQEYFLACISSHPNSAKNIIRKTARLASYYHAKWMVLYVQIPSEAADKIKLANQRHLINHLKLATEMGAEVVRKKNVDIVEAIMELVLEKQITTICIGKPKSTSLLNLFKPNLFEKLSKRLTNTDIDLIILS